MVEEDVLNLIKDDFPSVEVFIPDNQKRRIHVKINQEEVESLAKFLKKNGFDHLSFITCVDWIEEGKFELVYGLHSYEKKVVVLIKTLISRENPSQKTLMHLWEQARTYEREIHEMFGVFFEGNPRLIPFILEDWKGIPPMRKDFDSRKYSQYIYDTEAE